MEAKTIKHLQTLGIYLHSGGVHCDSLMAAFSQNPFYAIYVDSEEPTEEEINILAELVQRRQKRFGTKEFTSAGAATYTFYKAEGVWRYRSFTWSMGPLWIPYPKGIPLKELIKESRFE
jgi:hypothetical protein